MLKFEQEVIDYMERERKEELLRLLEFYGYKEKANELFQLLELNGYTREEFLEALGLKKKEESESMEGNLRVRISELIRNMGMPANLKGFVYLKRAVELVYGDRTYLEGIMTGLYQDIANEYGATVSRVERTIRHAIERMSNNVVKGKLYDQVLGRTVPQTKHSNSQCIAAIVEYLKMEDEVNK